MIIETLGSQSNRLQATDRKTTDTEEDSSENLFSDQAEKEAHHYVVQKDDILSEAKSQNKIVIQELIVINGYGSGQTILSSPGVD